MQTTDPRILLKKIANILRRLKIPYIVTGGIAVLLWGRPRFTADIDIVIELKTNDIEGLAKALRSIGPHGYIDEDVMTEALEREGEFNFIDGITGVKVDFWIQKDGEIFDIFRFKRKKAKTVLGERIFFTSPEDLILSKLQWYKKSGSTRHLEDIESIFKISGKKLDKKYLSRWVKKWGMEAILKKVDGRA